MSRDPSSDEPAVDIELDRDPSLAEVIDRASRQVKLTLRRRVPKPYRERYDAGTRYLGIALSLIGIAIAAYTLVEIAFIVVAPLVGLTVQSFQYTFGIRILGFVVIALMWDLIGGQMGYASFGNMAFFGLGVYVTAMLLRGSIAAVGTQPFAIALLTAGLLCLAYGFLLGIPLLRLRGHYFAVATLGVFVATQQLIANMRQAGLGSGIVIPQGGFGNVDRTFFLLFAALTVIAAAAYLYLVRARFGLGLNAIRDDEHKANSMGIHATKYKIIAWSISALFTGLAGALFAVHNAYINPLVAFNVDWTVFMILMVLAGGIGRFWGPVIGASLLWTIRNTLWSNPPWVERTSEVIGFPLSEAYIIVFGIILVVMVVGAPQGILGYLEDQGVFRYTSRRLGGTRLGWLVGAPEEVDTR